MTDLRTLSSKKTISQMSIDELQNDVVEIRSNRRNFPERKAAKTKANSTKKAVDKASVDELKVLLKTLEEM